MPRRDEGRGALLARGLREYRAGTFEKRVAYGQRERKLKLVARGIIKGFYVRCKSEYKATNLALAFRVRARHIESNNDLKFSVGVKVVEKTVYVTRRPKYTVADEKIVSTDGK